jgi:hypothetical protein
VTIKREYTGPFVSSYAYAYAQSVYLPGDGGIINGMPEGTTSHDGDTTSNLRINGNHLTVAFTNEYDPNTIPPTGIGGLLNAGMTALPFALLLLGLRLLQRSISDYRILRRFANGELQAR